MSFGVLLKVFSQVKSVVFKTRKKFSSKRVAYILVLSDTCKYYMIILWIVDIWKVIWFYYLHFCFFSDISSCFSLYPFLASALILYPWVHFIPSENIRKPLVFRGYKMWTLARNLCNLYCHSITSKVLQSMTLMAATERLKLFITSFKKTQNLQTFH